MTGGNEQLYRRVNQRIHQLTHPFGEVSEYLCECGRPACRGTMVAVHPAVFADVIAVPGMSLVALGHETPDLEIVRHGRGYLIVRKAGDGSVYPAPRRANRRSPERT
jgi:hypothetical protein